MLDGLVKLLVLVMVTQEGLLQDSLLAVIHIMNRSVSIIFKIIYIEIVTYEVLVDFLFLFAYFAERIQLFCAMSQRRFYLIRFYGVRKCIVLLGIVQGGVKCGDEYLPGLFTRLTDPNILQFVQNSSGLILGK